MTTINASEEAYKRILKSKQMMEEESGRVVSVSKALDVLLWIRDLKAEVADLRGVLLEEKKDV